MDSTTCKFAVFIPARGWFRFHWTVWAAYLLEVEREPELYEGWRFVCCERGVKLCL